MEKEQEAQKKKDGKGGAEGNLLSQQVLALEREAMAATAQAEARFKQQREEEAKKQAEADLLDTQILPELDLMVKAAEDASQAGADLVFDPHEKEKPEDILARGRGGQGVHRGVEVVQGRVCDDH